MTDRIPVRVAHAMAGRTRLVALNPAATDALHARAALLAEQEGVSVAFRGSSLIVTHPVSGADLPAMLDQAGLVLSAVATRDPISHATSLVHRLNAGFADASGGRMDFTNLAFMSLLAAGFVQMARGNITGPALTLFSQALTLAVLHGKAQQH